MRRVRRARRLLDHAPQQGVADVGVLEALVAAEHGSAVAGRSEQPVGVGELTEELPEVAIPAVTDDAAAVSEQLTERDPRDRRAGQLVDPRADRIIEVQHALLGQTDDRGGGERLGVRGDPEAVGRGHRRRRLQVGQPAGRRHHDVAVVQHRHLHAGDPVALLAVGDQRLDVPRRVEHGLPGRIAHRRHATRLTSAGTGHP